MKIVLRKKDSVTSIVLFIFNIYGEYTGEYSIGLNKLIRFMQLFDKNETSTRMGLSRMVKAGILANKRRRNEVCYQLTEYGLENIRIWNEGIVRFFARFKKRHTEWDQKWYLAVLMNFNKSEKENQSVVDELEEIGLREVEKNIWLCPYRVSDEIADLSTKNDFKYVELWGGNINYNFPADRLLEDVFKTGAVRKSYHRFRGVMEETKKEYAGLKDNDGCHLPLLFKLGWNFYDTAVSDPALPGELVGDWEGDRVVKEFRLMRQYLYDQVTGYFQQSG
ncbi:MAG: hypothetical protein CVU89_06455 [Firmicutes bacterium HGW-Firmicutes-14]|nr:MAG: hypothetical protein CVU89_06455 [Firmicutes bacterium HGW-Firmicutes-14]